MPGLTSTFFACSHHAFVGAWKIPVHIIMLPRLRPLLLILIWSLGGIVACAQETTSAGSRPAPTATPTLPKPNDPALNKYFHEPKANDLDHLQQLGHHDARYFHGLVSEEERIVSLTHMTRAYLNTFQELGLETWIAHGALLGWWWNAKVQTPQSRCFVFNTPCRIWSLTLDHRFFLGTGMSTLKCPKQLYDAWATNITKPHTSSLLRMGPSIENTCWMSILGLGSGSVETAQTSSTHVGSIHRTGYTLISPA